MVLPVALITARATYSIPQSVGFGPVALIPCQIIGGAREQAHLREVMLRLSGECEPIPMTPSNRHRYVSKSKISDQSSTISHGSGRSSNDPAEVPLSSCIVFVASSGTNCLKGRKSGKEATHPDL